MDKIDILTPIHSDSLKVVPRIQRLPEFMQFINWFATPGQFRKPKTQKEFARIVGVCEDTLTDWKLTPHFWPLVQQSLSRWIKDRLPDAIGGLYLNASDKGSPKAVEMFLRLGGILDQKSQNDSSNSLKIN